MKTFALILRRVLRAIAVLALVCAAGLAWADPEPGLNEVYAAAQAGNLDQAQLMMQQVLISHPNSAKAHYVRSELFARQGNLARAREALATAEKLAPGLPFARPESVQALRSQLSADKAAPAKAQPAAAPGPVSPSWALPVLLAGAVIAAGYFMFRRQAPRPAPRVTSGRFGHAVWQAQGAPRAYGPAGGGHGPWGHGQAGQGQAGYGQPPGRGLGGRIAGGLTTGLAVGAGVMAAEALARNLGGDHGRDPRSIDSFSHNQDDLLRRHDAVVALQPGAAHGGGLQQRPQDRRRMVRDIAQRGMSCIGRVAPQGFVAPQPMADRVDRCHGASGLPAAQHQKSGGEHAGQAAGSTACNATSRREAGLSAIALRGAIRGGLIFMRSTMPGIARCVCRSGTCRGMWLLAQSPAGSADCSHRAMMKTPDIPANMSNVQGHQAASTDVPTPGQPARAPGASDQPAGGHGGDAAPAPAAAPMSPGDEAPPGTPGTGEDVCPRCGGSGRQGDGECPECQGSGRVTVGIGGA